MTSEQGITTPDIEELKAAMANVAPSAAAFCIAMQVIRHGYQTEDQEVLQLVEKMKAAVANRVSGPAEFIMAMAMIRNG